MNYRAVGLTESKYQKSAVVREIIEVGTNTPLTLDDLVARYNALTLDANTARAAAFEEAAQIAENEPRVWDINAAPPQQRIAAAIRARKS